jgi:outer membrane receptor protein involved in Fe transport
MSVRPVVTALFPALLLLPALAPAQSAGPLSSTENGDIDEVVVTGSRIVREELTAQSPIAVIDAENIRIQNVTTIEEVLRRSPQFAAAIGSQTNNGNEGAATVDLRNLGEERTLVLVDGKRFVPFDPNGVVDINMIPASLLERVEVVTGGASATYGSEAVAGVVNFILKKDFEGLEVNTLYGITQEGDGDTYGFDVTTGTNFAGGRGNIVLNVGYTKQDAVLQGDRGFSRIARDELLQPFGSFNAEEASTLYSAYPGDPFAGCLQFDAASNPVDCVNTFNFNPPNLFQVPQQRWTATALGRFEITDTLEFFTRASFANNQTVTRVAPTPTGFAPFRINTDNALLPQAVRDQFALIDQNECDDPVFDADDELIGCDQLSAGAGDGIIDIALGKRFTELGTRDSRFENTAFQFVGGLRGEFAETQRWETFAQYGRTSRNQRFSGDVSGTRLQNALVSDLDGDGNPFCFRPEDPLRTPIAGCVPANIFGPGTLTGAGADYVRIAVQEINTVDQLVVGGSLTGDLPFTLPTAGDAALSYAAGVEYRQEQGQSTPDEAYIAGDALGFGSSSPIDAEIDIREVFGELLVPVVRDLPFAEAINLEGGVRFARYKNNVLGQGADFDNTSYKVGADWSPVGGLRFRGMFQRAVRAPNLEEIGQPRTAGIGDLTTDPCEGTDVLGNPALEQLCIDTGVPPGRIGSVVSIIAGQIGVFRGGDVGLEPEEADTVTFGVVLQDLLVDGLVTSIDYYNIEVDNAIVEPLEQNVVNACYDIEQNASSPFCQRIIRSPVTGGLNAGPAVGVEITRLNAGSRTAEGIDIALSKSFGFESGELGINVAATYIIEQVLQDADFLPSNDCAGLVGNTCLRPYNEWNVLAQARWTTGPLAVQVDGRYLSPVTQDALVIGGADPADFGIDEIPSYFLFNLNGQYDLNDTWTLRAGIDNLFDRQPENVGTFFGGTAENSGNTYPAVYDALGRAFTVGVSARF